jgi:hypothetical protein
MTEAERQIAFRKAWDARVIPSGPDGSRGPTCQCHGISIIGTTKGNSNG